MKGSLKILIRKLKKYKNKLIYIFKNNKIKMMTYIDNMNLVQIINKNQMKMMKNSNWMKKFKKWKIKFWEIKKEKKIKLILLILILRMNYNLKIKRKIKKRKNRMMIITISNPEWIIKLEKREERLNILIMKI